MKSNLSFVCWLDHYHANIPIWSTFPVAPVCDIWVHLAILILSSLCRPAVHQPVVCVQQPPWPAPSDHRLPGRVPGSPLPGREGCPLLSPAGTYQQRVQRGRRQQNQLKFNILMDSVLLQWWMFCEWLVAVQSAFITPFWFKLQWLCKGFHSAGDDILLEEIWEALHSFKKSSLAEHLVKHFFCHKSPTNITKTWVTIS